jgi:glycosyltransferase involved in cell wall biosynthesis
MKILLVHNYYRSSAPSGENVVYESEKTMLSKYGVEVLPYEIHNDNLSDRTIIDKLKAGINTIWSFKSYREISNVIREYRPDIAHFHNTFPQISPSAYKACKDNNVAVVQTLHNFRIVCPNALLMRKGSPCEKCLDNSLIYSLIYKCYRDSYLATMAITLNIFINRLIGTYKNNIDKYITLTEFSKSRFVKAGIHENKILIKPNFISITNNTCVDQRKHYAIYVGRLTEEKGVRTLIDAWSMINDLKLIIVGDGDLREELESKVKNKQLDVEFRGTQDKTKVLELVSNAMLQIIPSECYEGFPNVLLEAYTCGTPVISSAIGSLNELVEDGKNGFKFKAKDPVDLVRKINHILDMKGEISEISKYSKELVNKKYTEAVNVDHLLKIYSIVLEQE